MKRLVSLTLCLVFAVFTFATNLNPVKEYDILPDDYGMDYEEVEVTTEDKLTLFGWHFKPLDGKSKKCIIMSHDGDGNMADLLERAGNLMSIGYHVFTYDYRGYGKSQEFRINTKFYIYSQFAKDLTAVLKHVKKFNPTFAITLYGEGIGAGLSIGVGANNVEVHRVIADAPYLSFETIEKRYKELTGEKILMPLGYDKVYMEPMFALAEKGNHLRGIMYVIGDQDKMVLVEDIEQMVELKKKLSTVYTVVGVENKDNFETNKNEYFTQVKKFLED
jgi:hypothetical protein